MKRIESSLQALAAALVITVAAGAAHADGPGGSYIQGAYANWDDLDDGFNIAGSVMATPNLRLFADFTSTDLDQLRIGGGWTFPMAGETEIEVGASYQRFEIGRFDDDGVGIHGVVRFSPVPGFRIAGKLEYVILDDFNDETIIGIDAEFRFMPSVSGFASFDVYDEADNLFKLGVRLHF
jgi:hypothetical protein